MRQFNRLILVEAISDIMARERRELRVFKKLLAMVPGFEDRIMKTESEEEIMSIASMV